MPTDFIGVLPPGLPSNLFRPAQGCRSIPGKVSPTAPLWCGQQLRFRTPWLFKLAVGPRFLRPAYQGQAGSSEFEQGIKLGGHQIAGSKYLCSYDSESCRRDADGSHRLDSDGAARRRSNSTL
jgi:hypothetical protein